MRNSLFIFSFLLLSCSMVFGQKGFSFTAGYGSSYYYGDLSDYYHNLNLNPAFHISYGQYFTPSISLRIGLTHSTLSSADSLTSDPALRRRDLHFKTKITELSGMIYYELNPDKYFGRSYKTKPHFTPYIFGGVAVFSFNPKAYHGGEWVALQPQGTEGQNLQGDYPDPYSLLQLAFPAGFGISHRFTNNVAISFDIGYRLSLTDYLDDVSTVYPDLVQLKETDNGLAAQLSDPTGRFQAGQQRGSPAFTDSYIFAMGAITFYLDRNGKR